MAGGRPSFFPFTPPNTTEAAALAVASAFLLRAANEVRSGRLVTVGFLSVPSTLEDLPASLHAAGELCDGVMGNG